MNQSLLTAIHRKGYKIMPSCAFKNYKRNIIQVDRLIATYDTELSKSTSRGRRSLDHLTRASLLFLCSSFEVYIEEVTRESGDVISKNIKLPGELPRSVKKNISEYVKKEKNELSPILFFDDWKKYYNDLIYSETKSLNTPKIDKIQLLFKHYIGLDFSISDLDNYPYSNLNDIIVTRGEIAHNVFGESYLTKVKLIEYYDTINATVRDIDMKLYSFIPSITSKCPWRNTY